MIIIIIANQGSSLVRPTQSRHSLYKRTIWFAPWRGQAPRWAYTNAMAGWPLFGLRCHRQHPDHRQRSAGGC